MSVYGQNLVFCAKNPHSTVPSIPVPSRRFSHVHVDLVGPLPSSQGYSYLLTMIDRTTRWPEVIPMSSISDESCVHAFISAWVSRFGVSAVLTLDRGCQFTSSIWTVVCSVLGISASKKQPPSILKVTEWLKGSIGVPGQAIRFRLVFSSSSSSLGIVSYSEG